MYIFSAKSENHLPASFIMGSLRRLVELGFFDHVIKCTMKCPLTVSAIRDLVIMNWYLFTPEQLQITYDLLKPAIMLRMSSSALSIGWKPVIEAAKKRPTWLHQSAQWLTAWRNLHVCFPFVDPKKRSEVMEGEPELLAACETPKDFGILRELASGEANHERLDLDVIFKHLEFSDQYHGKSWVLDRLLFIVGDGEKLNKNAELICIERFRMLARMFPVERLYHWAAKRHIVVTDYHIPDFNLATKCGIAPILYGCHSKGLYAQTNRLTLEPVSITFRDGVKTLYIPPDVDKRVLYVDTSNASMKLDWLFGAARKMHHIDAKDMTCRVDVCDDGVELYLDNVQQVTHANDTPLPLKITRFASLMLQSVQRNKRKFNLVE